MTLDQQLQKINPGDVYRCILDHYNIQEKDLLTTTMKASIRSSLNKYRSKKRTYIKRRHQEQSSKINWAELANHGSTELTVCTLAPTITPTKPAPRKSFEDLNSRKQMKNRTDKVWKIIQTAAEDEGMTPKRIIWQTL